MPREWILNQAMNRWGLNKKHSVGPTSESIRICGPRAEEEWESFYYSNVRPREHLVELGKKLYVKITEVIACEVEEITEQDCIDYMRDVVIRRTFQGYQTEIRTVYGQLEQQLQTKIRPAPDEWDRLYGVDFFVEIQGRSIGIQIKPTSFDRMPEDYRWKEMQRAAHARFQEKYGGAVFTVFSVGGSEKKEIANAPEVTKNLTFKSLEYRSG